MDRFFICKKCGHDFEDHVSGLYCAYCAADLGYNAGNICVKFEGDNLKYLEEKHRDQE